MSDIQLAKKNAAIKMVDDCIKSGLKIGLGSGTTAKFAIQRISELQNSGKIKDIYCVRTSLQTEILCMQYNLHLYSLNDPQINGHLDFVFDGADEVDSKLKLIKGGGGAFLLEKVIASTADRYAIIVDNSKIVKYLGQNFLIPVEVIPFALISVQQKLQALKAKTNLRMAKSIVGPVITEAGNLILDIGFDTPFAPEDMEKMIKLIPGVVECGIFTRKVDDLYIGYPDGSVEHKKNS